MKTIGILGGMSWQSSAIYYRLLNEGAHDKLGGFHSADLVMHSVDFAPYQNLLNSGEWAAITANLSEAAKRVEDAGADFLLLATNTMHKVADDIQAAINIPLLHIADAVGEECRRRNIEQIGLLGTAFTMEEDFYKKRLQQHGVTVLLPAADERHEVNRVVFEELCLGDIQPASKKRYLNIIEGLAGQGAQAVLLGCTEIGLLVQQGDCATPLLDSTVLHVQQALRLALE